MQENIGERILKIDQYCMLFQVGAFFLIINLQEELMPFSKEHVDTALLLKLTSLLDNARKIFFCNMQKAHHCLFGILPAENEHEHEIQKYGHNFVSPHCTSNLFKASFLNRCLFSLI